LERKTGLVNLLFILRKFYNLTKPDIVHIQYLAPGLTSVIAAKLSRIKMIFVTSHVAGSHIYGTKAKLMITVALLLSTKFICVSRGVENFWFGQLDSFDFLLQTSRKHLTIYNGIDVNLIQSQLETVNKSNLRQSLGISESTILLGSVGRLAPQKGHSFLLHAFQIFLKKYPNSMLMIIGEGPNLENLKALAQELEVDQAIIWIGKLSQSEVFKYYGIMDLFTMPSLYEGFGLAAAEAMAAGVPVVASNIEGLNEIVVHGKTGYLVKPTDHVALADAMFSVFSVEGTSKAMGHIGQEIVKTHFSIEKYQQSIMQLYQ
jgi:glycosyltransferase involved in cell wall biosynthesis